MERLRRDTLLGLVFFGTLLFLLWATINLTDVSLNRVPPLVVSFPDAGSAEVGTNVMVLGKKVGKVGAIDVVYERADLPVQMTLLLKEHVPLTTKYTIEVRDAGVLGGKQIYVDPGRGTPLPDGTDLRGASQPSAFERIGNIADAKGELGQNLNAAITAIRSLFENMNNEESSIGRLVRRRELYDEYFQVAKNINTVLDAVNKGDGVIGRLVVDRGMRENAMRFVENLAKVSDQLLATDGTIGLLLNDRPTAENVRGIVADVSKLVTDAKDGKGALGRILTDQKMADDLADSLANLSTLLAKANDPQAGVLGTLSSDKETGENLRVAIANVREVTAALTRNDGMLGALLNDKDLGVRFRRIMTQVSRALEDAREAAPIGNFVQVLLGAF